MKTVILEHTAAAEAAAAVLCMTAQQLPKANIGLFVDRDCLEIYRKAFTKENSAIFSGCGFFVLNEFCGADGSSEGSVRHLFTESFPELSRNCCFMEPSEPGRLDEAIAAAGGIELMFVGVGSNSSLAMNEPSVPYDSVSHLQKLTTSSRDEAAALLSAENAPEYVATAGVGTIVKARSIAAAAFGSSKSRAVFSMLYARTDSTAPSAFLQLPRDVSVFLDDESAAEL